jgi:hypothetical protein
MKIMHNAAMTNIAEDQEFHDQAEKTIRLLPA